MGDPLVGKRDKWLPGLNLGRGSNKKEEKTWRISWW